MRLGWLDSHVCALQWLFFQGPVLYNLNTPSSLYTSEHISSQLLKHPHILRLSVLYIGLQPPYTQENTSAVSCSDNHNTQAVSLVHRTPTSMYISEHISSQLLRQPHWALYIVLQPPCTQVNTSAVSCSGNPILRLSVLYTGLQPPCTQVNTSAVSCSGNHTLSLVHSTPASLYTSEHISSQLLRHPQYSGCQSCT